MTAFFNSDHPSHGIAKFLYFFASAAKGHLTYSILCADNFFILMAVNEQTERVSEILNLLYLIIKRMLPIWTLILMY